MHPLQGGYLRRKVRRTRRPGSPPDNALLFYARYWTDTLAKFGRLVGTGVAGEPDPTPRSARACATTRYTDIAIAKLPQEAEDRLEMLQDRPRLPVAQAG